MKRMTSRIRGFRPGVLTIFRLALGLWAAVFLLSGCAAGGKSSAAVRHYALEYPSPAFKDLPQVNDSIRVEPLSITRNYSSTAMVYRTKPYVYGDDAYNRWKVKPSVMVSDLLLRDLKLAGLFRGVFSYGDTENGGYALGGVIEELYELENTNGSQAVLALNVTLLNTGQQSANGRTVFQKNYRAVRDMETRDAESLAQAMSKAMETLSKEIILDVYKAIRLSGDFERKDAPLHGLSAK